MSAETSGEVCHINDEEVLRKMWQDTEDFGKKKEIRSHMYKLREERLKNFYSSADSGTEIRTTQQTSSLKDGNVSTHADSLVDHSFMSMKSKEIRDSESPTKDMHHFRTNEINRGGNQGWDVVTKNEISKDGKTHTLSKSATTSGSEVIDKGVANYSAQCEQKDSVYQDGDANNFTKSASSASKSVLRQEAKGGDDNNSYHTYSTSSSSSSKVVSQQHTSSDANPPASTDNQALVIRKVYTTDVPSDLKRNPNYIDGNTTVTTETRTLPDGTKVTTTRYETKGTSSTTKTVNNKHVYQTNKHEPSITNQKQTITTHVVRDVPDGDNQKPFNSADSTFVKELRQTTNSKHIDESFRSNQSINKSHVEKKSTYDNTDDVYITKTINEKEYTPREQHPTTKQVVSDIHLKTENIEGKTTNSVKTSKFTEDIQQQNVLRESQYEKPACSLTREIPTESRPKESATRPLEYTPSGTPKDYTPQKSKPTDDRPIINTPRVETTSSHIQEKQVITERCNSKPTDKQSGFKPEHPTPMQSNEFQPSSITPGDRTPSTNRKPEEYTPVARTPGDRTPVNNRGCERVPQSEEVLSKFTPNQPYDNYAPKPQPNVNGDTVIIEKITTTNEKTPGKNETIIIKPHTEKITTVTSKTTYQTDYTTKRISVDISPTHDAFARSLRASPDRDKKRGSTRSLKSSTSSLRSSTSPEKTYPYNRYPETSSLDRKQPGRISPTKYQPNSRESSPTKKNVCDKPSTYPSDRSPHKPTSDIKTNTITRRHKTDIITTESHTNNTLTRPGRPRSRSVSPTTSASDIEFIKRTDIVTDLDADDKAITRKPQNTTPKPTSLNIKDKPKSNNFEDKPTKSPSSPIKKYPNKDTPTEKPFKRRDTYEERCRQILGININQENTTSKVTQTTTTRVPSKKTPTEERENRKTPDSPKKGTVIQEYPSQTRKTPEKKDRPYPNANETTYHKTTKKDSPGKYIPNETDAIKKSTLERNKKSPDKIKQYLTEKPDESKPKTHKPSTQSPEKFSHHTDQKKETYVTHHTQQVTNTVKDTPTKPTKKDIKPKTHHLSDSDSEESDDHFIKNTIDSTYVTTKIDHQFEKTLPAKPKQQSKPVPTQPGKRPEDDSLIPKGRVPTEESHNTAETIETCITQESIEQTTIKPGDKRKPVPTQPHKYPKDDNSITKGRVTTEPSSDTDETYFTQNTIEHTTIEPGDKRKPVPAQPERRPKDNSSKPKEHVPTEQFSDTEETTAAYITQKTVEQTTKHSGDKHKPEKRPTDDNSKPKERVPTELSSDTEETTTTYINKKTVNQTTIKPGDKRKPVPTQPEKRPKGDSLKPKQHVPTEQFSDTEDTRETYITQKIVEQTSKNSGDKHKPERRPTDDNSKPKERVPTELSSDTEETTTTYINKKTVNQTTIKPGDKRKPVPTQPEKRPKGDSLKPKQRVPTEQFSDTEDTTETYITQKIVEQTSKNSGDKCKPGKRPTDDNSKPKELVPTELSSDTEETNEIYINEKTVKQTTIKPEDTRRPIPAQPGKRTTDDNFKPKGRIPTKQFSDTEETTETFIAQETIERTTIKPGDKSKPAPVQPEKSFPDDTSKPKGHVPTKQGNDTEETNECYITQQTVEQKNKKLKDTLKPKPIQPGKRPTDDISKPKGRVPTEQTSDIEETTEYIIEKTVKQGTIKPEDKRKLVPTQSGKRPTDNTTKPKQRLPTEQFSDTEETNECYITQETIEKTTKKLEDKRKPVSNQPGKRPTDKSYIPKGRVPTEQFSDTDEATETYTTQKTIDQTKVTTLRTDKLTGKQPTDDDFKYKGTKPTDRSQEKYPNDLKDKHRVVSQKTDERYSTQEIVDRTGITTKPVGKPSRRPVDETGKRQPSDKSPERCPSDTEEKLECSYTQQFDNQTRVATGNKPKGRKPSSQIPGKSTVTTQHTDEYYTKKTVDQTCLNQVTETTPSDDEFKSTQSKPTHQSPETTTTHRTDEFSALDKTIDNTLVITKPSNKSQKTIPKDSHKKPTNDTIKSKERKPTDQSPDRYRDDTEETKEYYVIDERVDHRKIHTRPRRPSNDDFITTIKKPIDQSPTEPFDKTSQPNNRRCTDQPNSDSEQTDDYCITQKTVNQSRVTTQSIDKIQKELPAEFDDNLSDDDSTLNTGIDRIEKAPKHTNIQTLPGEKPKKVSPVFSKQPTNDKPNERKPNKQSPEKYSGDTEEPEQYYTLDQTCVITKSTDKLQPGKRPAESDFKHKKPTDQPNRRPVKNDSKLKGRRPTDQSPDKYTSETEKTDENYITQKIVKQTHITTKISDKSQKVLPENYPADDNIKPKDRRPVTQSPGKSRLITEQTNQYYINQKTVDAPKLHTKPQKCYPNRQPIRDSSKPNRRTASDQSPDKYPSDSEEVDEYKVTQDIIDQTREVTKTGDTRQKITSTRPGLQPSKDNISPKGRKHVNQSPERSFEQIDRYNSQKTTDSTRMTITQSKKPQKVLPTQSNRRPIDDSSKPKERKPTGRSPNRYSDTEDTDQRYVTEKTIDCTRMTTKSENKPRRSSPTSSERRPTDEYSRPKGLKPHPSSKRYPSETDERYTQETTTITRVSTRPSSKPENYNKPKKQPVQDRYGTHTPKSDKSKPDHSREAPYYRSEGTHYINVNRKSILTDESKPSRESPNRKNVPQKNISRVTPDDSRPKQHVETQKVTRAPNKVLDRDVSYKPEKKTSTKKVSATVNVSKYEKHTRDSQTRTDITEYTDSYRIPDEENYEVTRKTVLRGNPTKRPQVEETCKVKNTYLTSDKTTVQRKDKLDVNSREQPFGKNNKPLVDGDKQRPDQAKFKTRPDEYSNDEDDDVNEHKSRDDFYTLNIKVYRKNVNVDNDQSDMDDKPYEKEATPRKSKTVSKPISGIDKMKSDKTTVYRTEEKHYINKAIKNPGKFESPDKDRQAPKSHKPIGSVTKVRDTKTTIKTKLQPDATRHVVTTTIQVVPKKKQSQLNDSKKLNKTSLKPSEKNKPRETPEDQHVTSDEECEIEDYSAQNEIDETNRTFDRQITRTITSPQRVLKPISGKPADGLKRPEKVITTKSIVINNDLENEKEIIVNLQRSKSSREATPDRSYAYPAPDNDEKGIPRYPDEICEPDDFTRQTKPTKLSDIPIIESDDNIDYPKKSLNRVDDSDDCLLTVNEKVSKFVNEADKLTKPRMNNTREADFYKVNVTDNRLNVTQRIPDRPKSPKCQNYSDEEDEETFASVSEKVSHFIETAEKIKSHQHSTKQKQVSKVSRPEFIDLDDDIKKDDCLLSVSDKVTKFTTTAKKQSPHYKKPVSLAKMDTRRSSSPVVTECVQIDTEEDTYIRKPSPDKPYTSTKKPTEPDTTPKSSRNESETKTVLSTTGRLRSTESIRKAKEMFENISKNQTPIKHKPDRVNYENKPSKPDDNCSLKSTRLVIDKIPRQHSPNDDEIPGYLRPLNRSPRPRSPYPERSESPKDRSISPSHEKHHDPALDNIPHYMWPLDRSVHEHESPKDRSRSPSHETHPKHHDAAFDNIPHYMWPLDRSVHEHEHSHSSDHDEHLVMSRESSPSYMKPLDRQIHTKSPKPNNDVTDKRDKTGTPVQKADSEKVTSTTTTHHKKLTTVEIENILSINEIEEIYDIEILEILLEWAVSYEQRRRVRSQVRIVKQLIIDHKLPKILYKKPRPISSKTKELIVDKPEKCYKTGFNRNEEETKYSYSERKHSTEIKSYTREISPETKIIRKSPDRKPQTKEVFKTELKRVEPISKKVVEEKPSWVTQRPLKKLSGDVPKSKPVTTKKQQSRVSPTKEQKPIDAITSSYGVGPTDENGSPLFGLKALRAQTRTGTTKVQGTVIKSHYYSENGHEPTGEVSVTKYSSDPNDFKGDVDETNGLVSVTTTQKFGTKGTPTCRAITDRDDYPEDEMIENYETRQSTTANVTRRGSVKQMSKKFIENAVETSKTEKQSSYPKAGLILRTSSFKKTKSPDRDSSPEGTSSVTTTTIRKTTTSSSSGGRSDTFLNNQTRVRGVQDVITRMKNSDDDVQEGDTSDDVEARKLLNKFIGSQVILSGIETLSSSSPTTASSTIRRTTTTTTTTSKGGGKPTVTTRTFTHPITQEDLDTIWDEQTLKLLLERSTEYEERRIIRGRLRDVMAEKEVCADVVSKANEESSGRVEEIVEKTEGPVTTTQVTTRISSQQLSKKPMSPFAKFRQLDKQNSLNTPPGTPRTPTGSAPLFKFTDPELNRQASTVKERLLQWCQMKTKEYENVQLDNFSSSWADGLAFCALIHHFRPDAFDYHALTPKERRHNFTLAFRIADEKADIVPLLDVDDMVATRKPDWKCVFTYVQTIYARFKNED